MIVGRSKCIVLTVLLLACSESSGNDKDGEGGGSPTPGGLRDDVALGSLSAQDRTMLCADFEEAEEPIVDAFDEELCTWQGLHAELLSVSSCEDYRSTCLEDEGEEEEEEEEEEEDDCPISDKVRCMNVTVKDLRDCNAALLARDKRAGERVRELKLTCGMDLPEDLDLAVPAICRTLLSKCPALDIEEQVD